jgi:Helix-turn-helix domain
MEIEPKTDKGVIDAESNDELVVQQTYPRRDGSQREPLPPKRWSQNLKWSAPEQMKKQYILAINGYKGTPLYLIMSAPTAETQYALLMDWYKMQHIDRPTVRKCRKFSLEELELVRELRNEGKTYREIGKMTNRSHGTIEQVCEDVATKALKTELNRVSKEKFGYHFSTLLNWKNGEARQKIVKEIVEKQANIIPEIEQGPYCLLGPREK